MEFEKSDNNLDQDVFDVLYEIGNLGVATAVKPIGNMREIEIHVETPHVISLNTNILSELDFEPEEIVVGVTTKISNSLEGVVLFLLSNEFAKNTVCIMTGEEVDDENLLKDEDSLSAIHEIVNYMTAGYAKVLGSYLGKPAYISPASVGMADAKSIVEGAIRQNDGRAEKIACVNTRFVIVDENGNETEEAGKVLIFPDENCIKELIDIMNE